MDPIFDRLGRLIRSMRVDDDNQSTSKLHDFGDPYLKEAEAELEEFLRTGRQTPKQSTFSQGQQSYQHQHQQQSRPQSTSSSLDPELIQAYNLLGLSPTATWDQVNAAHRQLLKKHHPDRHAGNEQQMKQATLQSQKIGEAYQKIKKYLGR